MTKVHSLPATKPGSKVRLAIQKVDTLLMELECKFIGLIEETAPDAMADGDAGDAADVVAEGV